MTAADATTGPLAGPGGEWGTHWVGAGGWPWLWPLLWVALIAVIAVLLWLALNGSRGGRRSGIDRAKDLLAERYARGEITTDEYRERLDQLR